MVDRVEEEGVQPPAHFAQVVRRGGLAQIFPLMPLDEALHRHVGVGGVGFGLERQGEGPEFEVALQWVPDEDLPVDEEVVRVAALVRVARLQEELVVGAH